MRKFSKLADAVRFLARSIETRDDSALADASREDLPADWVLDRLREQNVATPLVTLYAGRKFPVAAKEFKLGGHDRELGHIHIDFVRSGTTWQIQKIWMCR
jgi:hypothetical protein